MFTLVACGNQSTDIAGASSANGAESKTENSTENSNKTKSGKTLIVYYSATGNTKEVSQYIASVTKGDMFELVPEQPYSDNDLNWRDENSRVVYEHNNSDKRNVPLVSATPEKFEEYDTVFVGYPVWWGIAAWPVNAFIEANDFTGKTVIPFCTSSTSDLGNSAKLLKEAAGTGKWLDGVRLSSGVSETEVTKWVKNLVY